MIFRVVEMNAAYDFALGNGKGMVYVGQFYTSYYDALTFAIAYEKQTGFKTWVELITI